MDTRDVVHRYYELANSGEWERWCDLFATDLVMEEQLAGRIEGRERLREMMKGFPDMYSEFRNEPQHVLVEGEQAAVVSHIRATTPSGAAVEASVANYFRVVDGLITFMANFHDSVPFRAALSPS